MTNKAMLGRSHSPAYDLPAGQLARLTKTRDAPRYCRILELDGANARATSTIYRMLRLAMQLPSTKYSVSLSELPPDILLIITEFERFN